jgi:hypothetical protein
MRALLLALIASIVAAPLAHATQISAFGQTSGSNTVQATVNGTNSQTTLSVTNATVDLTQFINGPLNGLDFNLSATSIDAAQPIGTAVIQHYNGSFCISTGPGCTGNDVLSGTFSDAAFGAVGGPGLVVNVNNPPDQLALSSDVVSPALLVAPNTFGLTFSNLAPALAIQGTTIAPFTASFSGTVSASAAPEPTGLAVMGVGLLGLTLLRRRSG